MVHIWYHYKNYIFMKANKNDDLFKTGFLQSKISLPKNEINIPSDK